MRNPASIHNLAIIIEIMSHDKTFQDELFLSLTKKIRELRRYRVVTPF